MAFGSSVVTCSPIMSRARHGHRAVTKRASRGVEHSHRPMAHRARAGEWDCDPGVQGWGIRAARAGGYIDAVGASAWRGGHRPSSGIGNYAHRQEDTG